MPKQDFLMRMVEQLRGLLPYVLDLVRAGNYDEAHAVIDQAVRELVGIGTAGLVNLPDAVILDRLQAENAAAWEDKCLFLAGVLYEEARMLQKQGEEGAAYDRYLKALHLLLILAQSDDDLSERSELVPDIDEMVLALADYHLPGETCVKLMEYYEAMGEYTAVENTLFDWLENAPITFRTDAANPGKAGLELFQRLRQKPEADLEAGGLSLEEVETAIIELFEMGCDSEERLGD
jgi:CheY-like chemotaxis protein